MIITYISLLKICRVKSIHLCHALPLAGHPGSEKTLYLCKRWFWWQNMHQEIHEFVKSCPVCARQKAIHCAPAGLLNPLPIPHTPWSSISMYCITDLPASWGYTTILVVVDMLSKMAHFIPLKKPPTAKDLVEVFITHIIRLHGLPSMIVSDRDPQFVSKFWQGVCTSLHTDHRLSSAFHPQTDGQQKELTRH